MRLLGNGRFRRIASLLARRLFGDRRFAKRKAELARREECRHLFQVRLENLVEVRQPLVLISQVQRSGGTLLSQLFDGHPQCHAHPDELYVGYPGKAIWPVLNLQNGPDSWFNILSERPAVRAFREGYRKYSTGADDTSRTHPFLFLPSLQRAIFERYISSTTVNSQRDVFDCYMTSYFNAWVDNQNLYGNSKKYVTAFVPRMNMVERSRKSFFEAYPDGRLVTMIRDPRSWYASAHKHSERSYPNIEEAIRVWRLSATAMVEAKEQYGGRVYIMTFEELLDDTEATMRSLAAFLGIDFIPTLLIPTFNGLLIEADSSYRVRSYGVIRDPLLRYKEVLTTDEINEIESRAQGLYEKVAQMIDRTTPKGAGACSADS